MARRIPLPRLSRRQRTARWQRERRQQAIIVTAFSAVLLFVLGLVSWGASTKYYVDNLKPAMRLDGKVVAMRDWSREKSYQLIRFYTDYGVPPGYENDPQIAEQKASFDRGALDRLEEFALLDKQARAEGLSMTPESISARYEEDFGQFRSRHILITLNKDAADQAVENANALAKATAIRDQLRQDPDSQTLWNQLAESQSQDPGSAKSGGELGWVGKGQFVKPFEDAAKALSIGQISDPVKSDFGYHIIQVEQRRGPAETDVVKRWLATGFTDADIKRHTRYDLLRDAFTKQQQDRGGVSPTAQVRVAQIQVSTPRPVGGDFQSFTDQLKKVANIGKALDAGTDFAEVAKQYSEDSATKDKGGDMGWIARGMVTDLSAENELFNIPAGQRSQQHNLLRTTTWYKVLEKSDSRALEEDQKKTIKDSAYQYWLNQQKKAHDVVRLIAGLEFE
jgi:parvulin-like peptidyl-prolyl isomerase